MSADTRLWTKDFVAVTLANFFLMINYFMLIVVMADYAMTTFGAVPALAGAASSMFIVGRWWRASLPGPSCRPGDTGPSRW